MITPTRKVKEFGQSIWYDSIERSFVESGGLKKLMTEDGVSGLTSNPTIFQKAVAGSSAYDQQIDELKSAGLSPEEVCWELMKDDIRRAAAVMHPVWEETEGWDGYVSLEVNPDLARDFEGTVTQARDLFSELALDNLLIKVPGTKEGLRSIRQLISEGIRVNTTLLFSPERYQEVALAYTAGLEEYLDRDGDPSRLFSVASFFLSRIDTKVDNRLEELADQTSGKAIDLIRSLRGEAAVAVAKIVYARFVDLFDSPRFSILANRGGREQFPLWASTSTKNPDYSDVKYVESLIGPRTINTLPMATIDAFRDHGKAAPRLQEKFDEAVLTVNRLGEVGVDLPAIYQELETEGIEAFSVSYHQLLDTIEKKMETRR